MKKLINNLIFHLLVGILISNSGCYHKNLEDLVTHPPIDTVIQPNDTLKVLNDSIYIPTNDVYICDVNGDSVKDFEILIKYEHWQESGSFEYSIQSLNADTKFYYLKELFIIGTDSIQSGNYILHRYFNWDSTSTGSIASIDTVNNLNALSIAQLDTTIAAQSLGTGNFTIHNNYWAYNEPNPIHYYQTNYGYGQFFNASKSYFMVKVMDKWYAYSISSKMPYFYIKDKRELSK